MAGARKKITRAFEKIMSKMQEYKAGDRDDRPWGSYVVTAVGTNDGGEEYCEKDITVKSGQILSLQSHEMRREHWQVKEGTLTVILDGEQVTLEKGQDIRIPLRGIHCMANLSDRPCVVHERQEGVCREEDIKRYVDAYGRGTETPSSPAAQASVALYQKILSKLKGDSALPDLPQNGR